MVVDPNWQIFTDIQNGPKTDSFAFVMFTNQYWYIHKMVRQEPSWLAYYEFTVMSSFFGNHSSSQR
jgi:hypothetical protein